ncbi:hypothetical protein RCO28_20620 [Streptomyces sp. LHD-70]|uniref:hypothetical protein n=1 Tax=Streptomyces sp. LHD-70 TaxID=3072140 RepID=UPI00281020BB|nr:hypothetical protein [Streptomyces sp. LHD-70]MDQ8704877.1 hypothetical protein [Streptomyces sp. LHD-70]
MAEADNDATADRTATLTALYSADRQDSTMLVTARIALLALQLTYMGLVAIALSGGEPGAGPWVAAFSAFPLWFIHAYHLILVAVSMIRVRSVGELEDALYERSGLPTSKREFIGIRAGERFADIAQQPLPVQVQAAVSYGGIGAAMVAFSSYAVVVAARSDGWASAPVILAALLYLLLTAAALTAWLHVARLPRTIEGLY